MPLPAFARRWMDRRHGDTGGPTVLRYRRVYILPTRQGLVFAGILAAMWLAAVNYSNSMAFLLTFLLSGVFVAAMNHTFRNLVGLRVVPLNPGPVFAGEAAAFPLRLENDRRIERIDIGATASGPPTIRDVPAGDSIHLVVAVPARRRGRLSAGRVAIDSRYPAGLFRAWSWVRPAVTCTVYPRPEPDAPPPPGRGREGDPRGRRPAAGHEDFAGLRRYQRGDPVRRIAWKANPGQDPQVKQFTGTESDQLWLRWEDTAMLGALEQRLSRLCRWVLDCDRAGTPYGLALPGLTRSPGSGPEHRHACLADLADFNG